MAKQPKSLEVVFTTSAWAEWLAIWEWSASQFGVVQADKYLNFLEKTIKTIAQNPDLGILVKEHDRVRRVLAKQRASRYGHIIFYRANAKRLEILHFFHTSQDWQSRFES
jgi:plasmid stabilization system protein ParE